MTGKKLGTIGRKQAGCVQAGEYRRITHRLDPINDSLRRFQDDSGP